MEHGTALLQTWTAALFAAVVLQILANRLRLPAIVLLLLGGILLGPEVLGLVRPADLGSGLRTVISLAVAVILFEGGLTLEVRGFQLAPGVIRRMLTLGVGITWAGTALTILLLYDVAPTFAALAGSLTIVTGPTVIGPILRRVRVGERLHQILHWEGVLIDPIGVFIALGCFEWLFHEASVSPFVAFVGRLVVGVVVGIASGWLIGWILRHDWISETYDNLFVFTSAIGIFGVCDLILPESGLLAVTVAGLVLGLWETKRLKKVKSFKLDLTKLAIGVLFILLAARLDISLFARLGWEGMVLLLLLMFVLRPLNVFVSTWGSALSISERLFLSSLAPRGIVAASMASLFTLLLADHPTYGDQAWFLEVFTYAVIGATVFVQGLAAPLNARLLGVARPPRRTWLIVGARSFGQQLAAALRECGMPTVLVDVNADNVRRARQRGLQAVEADILDVNLFDDTRFVDVSAMLCATGNAVLDELACHRWQDVLDDKRTYRFWDPANEVAPPAEEHEAVAEGTPLWPDIGPIYAVEHELDVGDASIKTREVEPGEALPEGVRPLFALTAKRLEPVAEAEPSSSTEPRRYVVLEHKGTRFASLIRSVITIEDEHPGEIAVLRHLLDEVARFHPSLDCEELLEELSRSQRAMPNYVGHGVAVPHAYCDVSGESTCVVGRVRNGLDIATFDGEPIRLVFLLISPRGKAERHLEALGRLARIAADQDLVRQVIGAESPHVALRMMRSSIS